MKPDALVFIFIVTLCVCVYHGYKSKKSLPMIGVDVVFIMFAFLGIWKFFSL